MFPFGIQPEAIGAVPPDTVNRLLLHGARYHDRPCVFSHGEREEPNPDWRVDRHSLRIALALREAHGVEASDRVDIALPFGLELLLVERAVWCLGAVSSLAPSPPRRVVVDEEGVRALLEQGSVLDTPERASKLREAARNVSPSSLASIESEGAERSQATWVRDIESFLVAEPPRRGTRRVLRFAGAGTMLDLRIAAYAGWADGFTETVLRLE